MNDAKIMQLFQLFAMIPDAEPWRDLAEAETAAVAAMLRPGADPEDNRLNYYAAARANLRYREIVNADQVTPTYAGATAASVPDRGGCSLAERLVRAYRAECAALLSDDAPFYFAAAGQNSEGCT